MDFELTYRQFSERSILVEWPSEITENMLHDVLNFKNHLLNSNIKSLVQINNAYNSLLIIYDITIDKLNNEVYALNALYSSRASILKPAFKLWKIPVCYDDEFALDLIEISEEKRLSKSKIIKLHYEAIYTVFFIGFLPGFLYLGGLNKQLYFPRKKSPRQRIKKGAVAIGGEQTGIYPNVSPGGWSIIGNSPVELFKLNDDIPCFANAGDKIQFFPISNAEHSAILSQIASGAYQIESEVIDG
nr:5-oxoprolinase subunit PxpB [uncultured Psychroserpens sp.]